MRENGTERVTGLAQERAYGFRVAPSLSEREFQGMVLELSGRLGWDLAYHTHDSRRSAPGFPDLVLVSSTLGRTLFRELKTDVGRVSKPQAAWIDGLTAGGCDAAVWRPADLVSGRIITELRGEQF